MSKDILFFVLALCACTGLWVMGIMWYLDLWDTHPEHKDNKDEPPTFI
jgi:hypothetical protein